VAGVPGDNTNLSFNGQSLSLNKSKPARGKLVLLLGGICTGTGAGGFESFVKAVRLSRLRPEDRHLPQRRQRA
jgi:hypothetical protein